MVEGGTVQCDADGVATRNLFLFVRAGSKGRDHRCLAIVSFFLQSRTPFHGVALGPTLRGGRSPTADPSETLSDIPPKVCLTHAL